MKDHHIEYYQFKKIDLKIIMKNHYVERYQLKRIDLKIIMKNFKNKIYYCTKHCSKYRILFVKKREIELSISIDRSDKFQKKKKKRN